MNGDNINTVKEVLIKKLDKNIIIIKDEINTIKGCADESELIELLTDNGKCPSSYEIDDCEATEGECTLPCWECWEQAISKIK